jgi:hypothetical protein
MWSQQVRQIMVGLKTEQRAHNQGTEIRALLTLKKALP